MGRRRGRSPTRRGPPGPRDQQRAGGRRRSAAARPPELPQRQRLGHRSHGGPVGGRCQAWAVVPAVLRPRPTRGARLPPRPGPARRGARGALRAPGRLRPRGRGRAAPGVRTPLPHPGALRGAAGARAPLRQSRHGEPRAPRRRHRLPAERHHRQPADVRRGVAGRHPPSLPRARRPRVGRCGRPARPAPNPRFGPLTGPADNVLYPRVLSSWWGVSTLRGPARGADRTGQVHLVGAGAAAPTVVEGSSTTACLSRGASVGGSEFTAISLRRRRTRGW